MADELRRRTEEVLKQFIDLGDHWAEKIVVVNADGTAVGAGGGGGGLAPGDEVALTAATLAALENITVTDATLAAILKAEDAAAASGDTGVPILAVRRDANTSSVGADGDYSALHTDAEGKLKVTGGTSPATAGANTSVANAVADGVALAANANRKGATFFNDDTLTTGATVKLALGFAASATAYTVAVPAQGYFEVPFGYTGAINRYASAATGNLRITELT